MGLFAKLVPLLTGPGLVVVGKMAAAQDTVNTAARVVAGAKTVEGIEARMELKERQRLDRLALSPALEQFQKEQQERTWRDLLSWHVFSLDERMLTESQKKMGLAKQWVLRKTEMIQLFSILRREAVREQAGPQAVLLMKMCIASGVPYDDAVLNLVGAEGVDLEWLSKVNDERLKDPEFCKKLRIRPRQNS